MPAFVGQPRLGAGLSQLFDGHASRSATAKQFLGLGECFRPTICKQPGPAKSGRHELFGWHDGIDEADPLRLVGIDEFSDD